MIISRLGNLGTFRDAGLISRRFVAPSRRIDAPSMPPPRGLSFAKAGEQGFTFAAIMTISSVLGHDVTFDRFSESRRPTPNATPAQPQPTGCQGRARRQRRQLTERKAWCERGDSNPHPLRDQILSLARLPIPPLSRHAIINQEALAGIIT